MESKLRTLTHIYTHYTLYTHTHTHTHIDSECSQRKCGGTSPVQPVKQPQRWQNVFADKRRQMPRPQTLKQQKSHLAARC